MATEAAFARRCFDQLEGIALPEDAEYDTDGLWRFSYSSAGPVIQTLLKSHVEEAAQRYMDGPDADLTDSPWNITRLGEEKYLKPMYEAWSTKFKPPMAEQGMKEVKMWALQHFRWTIEAASRAHKNGPVNRKRSSIQAGIKAGDALGVSTDQAGTQTDAVKFVVQMGRRIENLDPDTFIRQDGQVDLDNIYDTILGFGYDRARHQLKVQLTIEDRDTPNRATKKPRVDIDLTQEEDNVDDLTTADMVDLGRNDVVDLTGDTVADLTAEYRIEAVLAMGTDRQTGQSTEAWQFFCSVFRRPVDDFITPITLKGWKRNVYIHQAQGALEILVRESEGNGGGYYNDGAGLGKTVIMLVTAQINAELSHMERAIYLDRRQQGVYPHLPPDTEEIECPSQWMYSMQCRCTRDSPTKRLIPRDGYTLIWTLKPALLDNYTQDFEDSIDETSNHPFRLVYAVGHAAVRTKDRRLDNLAKDLTFSPTGERSATPKERLNKCGNMTVIMSSHLSHARNVDPYTRGNKPSRIFIDEAHIHKNEGSGVFARLREHFPSEAATKHGPHIWPVTGTLMEQNPSEFLGYFNLMTGTQRAHRDAYLESMPSGRWKLLRKWANDLWQASTIKSFRQMRVNPGLLAEGGNNAQRTAFRDLAKHLDTTVIRRMADTQLPDGKTPILKLPDLVYPEGLQQVEITPKEVTLINSVCNQLLQATVAAHRLAEANHTKNGSRGLPPMIKQTAVMQKLMNSRVVSSWPQLLELKEQRVFGADFTTFTAQCLQSRGWMDVHDDPISQNIATLTDNNAKIGLLERILAQMDDENDRLLQEIANMVHLDDEEQAKKFRRERRKIVVLTPHLWSIAIVRKWLRSKGRDEGVWIDGSVPMSSRWEARNKFNDIEDGNETDDTLNFRYDYSPDAWFGTTNTCSFGLNLQRADRLILWDPIASTQSLEQSICRIHRLGQLRPVKIYKFLTTNSPIEQYVVGQQSKAETIQLLTWASGSDDEVRLLQEKMIDDSANTTMI